MLETDSTSGGEREDGKRERGAIVVSGVKVADEPIDATKSKQRKKTIKKRQKSR